eukprot:10867-Heterococcus_DN1.PRE.8
MIQPPAVSDSVDRSAAGWPASAGAPHATAKHIAAACSYVLANVSNKIRQSISYKCQYSTVTKRRTVTLRHVIRRYCYDPQHTGKLLQ